MRNIIITLIALVSIIFFSCEKQDDYQEIIEINLYSNNKTFVLDTLIGNTKVIIYNGSEMYSITVINGPASNIGCAIRNYSDTSIVYFSDSWIGKSGTETQNGIAGNVPVNEWLELKIVLYRNDVSTFTYLAIEGLGLDFFSGINKYKESISETYLQKFRLKV